jgi:hypothetical protein
MDSWTGTYAPPPIEDPLEETGSKVALGAVLGVVAYGIWKAFSYKESQYRESQLSDRQPLYHPDFDYRRHPETPPPEPRQELSGLGWWKWPLIVVGLATLFEHDDQRTPIPQKRTNYAPWMLLVYIPGLITGLVGMFSLVGLNWGNHTVRLITISIWGAFGGIVGLIILVGICICGSGVDQKIIGLALLSLGVFGVIGVSVLGILYNDWILGAASNNLIGAPSFSRSGYGAYLYWAYFVAKKLPLFST